jgi:prefoldin subunit 5
MSERLDRIERNIEAIADQVKTIAEMSAKIQRLMKLISKDLLKYQHDMMSRYRLITAILKP